jgi:hypothetical protein
LLRKRTRYSLLLMLALVAALAVAVWLRKTAPPEVARYIRQFSGGWERIEGIAA